MRTHYPRTPHLPWSPGASSDDVRLTGRPGLAGLTGSEVVVTEKMDGENTTLYADGLHARSLDSAHHPSRARVEALQGRVGPRILAGWRICGENVFARHSIPDEGRLRGRLLALTAALSEAGAADCRIWPRPLTVGGRTGYAIGLGATPPDGPRLAEIGAEVLRGIRDASSAPADLQSLQPLYAPLSPA